MSQSQYIKMVEREIQKLNKKIDLKILKGLDYREEARDHKILLRRMRYHAKPSLFRKFLPLAFQF